MQGSPVRNPSPLERAIAQKISVGLENDEEDIFVRIWGCERLLLCRLGVLSPQWQWHLT
jgi:hypothetical protein